MFDKYDPKTRNPASVFTNRPGDPLAKGDTPWMDVFGELTGLQSPQSGTDSGQPQYQSNVFGHLGYLPDVGNASGSNGLNDQFLANLGWTGGDPYHVGMMSGNESGQVAQGDYSGYTPEFQQFMKDKGYTFKQRGSTDNRAYLQAFDGSNNPVGTPYAQGYTNDDGFGLMALAATAGAGAAAGGAFSGAGAFGTGAAPSAGAIGGVGISPESLAYGTLENGAAYGGGAGSSLTASSEAGFGGALGGEAATGGMTGISPVLTGEFGELGYGAAGGGGWGTGAAGAAASGGAAGGAGGASSLIPGISNGSLLNAGGSLVNGLIGAYTGNKALDRQTDATNAANALWAPYRQFGEENLGRANGLLKNPGSIAQDPGFQFTTQQGVHARDSSAAARGGLYSGAQQKALTRFGQDNANTYFDKILGRYTGAAQLGATGTTNISNNLTNLGQAGAGAAMYQGNVAQNAINNGLGQFKWSQYTNDLRKSPNGY